ncbi:MAG: hypothetical protein ACJ71Q_08920 [Terriglobales bacterium]
MKPNYDPVAMKATIEKSAEDLRQLLIQLPDKDAVTDVFDYMVGALYGLRKAIDLGFVDRPGGWHSSYRPHLPQYVEAIQTGKPLNQLWLAGFYFNSAIQRLAACFDRIPKLLQATGGTARTKMKSANKASYKEWDAVYNEINVYKHNTEGRATGREVGTAEAVAAFNQAVALLLTEEAKLKRLYS